MDRCHPRRKPWSEWGSAGRGLPLPGQNICQGWTWDKHQHCHCYECHHAHHHVQAALSPHGGLESPQRFMQRTPSCCSPIFPTKIPGPDLWPSRLQTKHLSSCREIPSPTASLPLTFLLRSPLSLSICKTLPPQMPLVWSGQHRALSFPGGLHSAHIRTHPARGPE